MISKNGYQRIVNIGKDLIVLNKVEGSDNLIRVMINSKFVGFMEKKNGEYYRLDGHDIHNLIFARLCQMLS
ncbi:hypothetical protein [Pedobacter sp. Leaf132]|uniref:hypothetical protein n=1 Tax=Pedobacter sp. Leaf132 TaxID=2876557 RepID=UPI001E2E34D7|nr:hypothetical protein [Pedobacter sp. Leaf132]